MREITAAEATELRSSGAAGWYAIYANPPEPHPKQHVVEVGQRFFLTDISEFKIEAGGIVHVPDLRVKFKQLHKVLVQSDELAALLLQESEKAPEVKIDGVTARNGNVLRTPTVE